MFYRTELNNALNEFSQNEAKHFSLNNYAAHRTIVQILGRGTVAHLAVQLKAWGKVYDESKDISSFWNSVVCSQHSEDKKYAQIFWKRL